MLRKIIRKIEHNNVTEYPNLRMSNKMINFQFDVNKSIQINEQERNKKKLSVNGVQY